MQPRNHAEDEQWIRDTCTALVPHEVVYIRHEHYDGGYEVRAGSHTFFLEYDVIDLGDRAWVAKALVR